ncbi:MAG: DUF58 domain-containing protein [Fimbriiglobus sp.]
MPQPRPKIRLTRAAWVWLAVALMIVLVGWYKTINLLVLSGYILIALMAVNLLLAWRASSRMRAERMPTPTAFAGETVTIQAEISNEGDQAITTLVTAMSPLNQSSWLLAPLDGEAKKPITARWSFPKRGRHSLGPLTVDSSYPLGLIHVIRELVPEDHILVLPQLGTVEIEPFRVWLRRQTAGEGETRRPSRQAAPGGGDVRGLRAYRPGDSPRQIHWKTSARRNQLLVMEYDKIEPLDVVLILDPYLPDLGAVSDIVEQSTWARQIHERQESERRLEWMLSLTATLAMSLSRADTPAMLTLMIPGTPPKSEHGRAAPAFIRRAFTEIAEIVGMASVPIVPADFVRPRSGRATRIVMTSRERSPLTKSLRAAGLSTIEVSAMRPPVWFHPPASLVPKPAGKRA